MITVSNDYKQALTQPRRIDAKIIIGDSEITSDEINQINRNINCGLFKTVMKEIIVDSNVEIEKNTEIEPKFGLYIDGNFEYISLGNYKTIQDAEMNKDTNSYQIYGYDKIVESMIDFGLTEEDITYPCTVRNLYLAIFTKLGWDTSGIPLTFTNSESLIETDVFSEVGMTYRDVLDELSTISCKWLVDIDDVPTLISPTATDETINEEYLSDNNVTIEKQAIFNSLVFSRASGSDNIFRQDTESIETNGLHEYKVKDLQILSLNWRDNFIDEMWNYLSSFQYYCYDINTNGITYLEPLDNFDLSIFNNTYNTILLNDELIINQGVSERIYADEPEETQTEYKYADTTDRKINQTYLIVDKQNGQIEALTSRTNDIETIENNNYQELLAKFDNIASTDDITTLQNLVRQIQTDTYTKTEIQQIASGVAQDGTEVSYVKTASATFDENGMHYEKSGANTSSTVNETGVTVTDTSGSTNSELLFAGYDSTQQEALVRVANLYLTRYLGLANWRIEQVTDSTYGTGIGFFYLG